MSARVRTHNRASASTRTHAHTRTRTHALTRSRARALARTRAHACTSVHVHARLVGWGAASAYNSWTRTFRCARTLKHSNTHMRTRKHISAYRQARTCTMPADT
uniref:Uncharacterized protein n=1 Tax=Chrysotila carterae TaxID=13221 RepID=A0A7S4BUS7_CHRCT